MNEASSLLIYEQRKLELKSEIRICKNRVRESVRKKVTTYSTGNRG